MESNRDLAITALREIVAEGQCYATQQVVRAAELLLESEPAIVRLEPHIEQLLERLLQKENEMAANESSESAALDAAIAALNTELDDVSTVDGEVAADLAALPGIFAAFSPTTVEQVNAVTAATERVASITAALKAAGATAATAETGAEASEGGEKAPETKEQAVSLYTFTPAEGVVADTRFSPAPLQALGGGELLTFSGDTVAGESNGISVPGYSLFTGPTEPVPA